MKKKILIVRCKKELSNDEFYTMVDSVQSAISKGVLICDGTFDVEVAEIDVELTEAKVTLDGEEIAKNIRKGVEEVFKNNKYAKGGMVTY